MNKFKNIFRSLKYRNFRLFFPGLITSQIGVWIQNVALSWLIYDITKSPLAMGTIMFINTAPLFLITPFAGVIVDKFNRRKLLITIQILFALQAFLIAIFTLSGNLRISTIIILGLFLNIIAAIDAPLRQSTYILLVEDKKDLGNALSLNSTCFNVARFIGPAIAGVLVSSVGAGWCFAINFFCILPSVILVFLMKFDDVKSEKIKNESIFEGLKEGLSYIFHSRQISLLLSFLAIFSFIALAYPILTPIYTKDVLHANADILGYIMGCAGIGALFGSILLASKSSLRGLKYIICGGAAILSIGFILMGLIHIKAVVYFLMFCIGFGMISAITSDNMTLQSIVDNDKRGRVMSIYTVCFMGATSLSNFVSGAIAQVIGISHTYILFGIVMLIVSLFFTIKFWKIKFL